MPNMLHPTAASATPGLFRFARILNVIGMAVLALMMFLTTADVILRYVFNRPITGAYELTEFMMAILVAFGLAHTQAKKGHISVGIVIERFSERTQAVVNAVTSFLSLALFGVIAWRTIVYAQNLQGYASQSLGMPVSPFPILVGIGAITICLIYIVDIMEYVHKISMLTRRRTSIGFLLMIVGVIVLISTPAWPAAQNWEITPIVTGYIGVALLIIMLFSGMSIGMVMALIGFLGMSLLVGLGPALTSIGSSPYTTASSYSLSVIPLFILMGDFIFHSGLGRELYFTVYRWLGTLRGGLAMATVGACALFAAVSGSSVATVATMGTVALPEMRRFKYDVKLAMGTIAASGSIGVLIPPSVILVLYGILTEQSIGKLFLAGFIPGVLEAVFYLITIYILCRMNPQLGPKGESSTIVEKFASLKNTWGVIALFVLVIGGM